MLRDINNIKRLKCEINKILAEELYTCDLFNTYVDCGMISADKINDALNKLRKNTKNPDIHNFNVVNLTKDDIMSNPYLKNINISNVTINGFSLCKKRLIPPRTITKYDHKVRDLEKMRQVNSYFTCDRPLRFPGLV